MNPTLRYAVRCVGFGLATFLGSLQGNLPGIDSGDLVSAGIAGAIVGLGYAGIGAATPLEPAVGVGKGK